MIRFAKGDRKVGVMRKYLVRQEKTGHSGVAAIGDAQESQNVFAANRRENNSGGVPWYSFTKADRRVTCFYFYLWDEDFGPGFIKICSCFPYPIKVWVNGHEWAKRQASKAGVAFAELSNGFQAGDDTEALQGICDRLGPTQIQAFFDRWMDALPEYDRTFGYWWELRQIETSRTIVFDAPRHARGFVEALIADNLDVGRPDTLELIFGRKIRRGSKRRTQDVFYTEVVTADTLNTFYKHSRIKQFLKDVAPSGSRPSSTRALRFDDPRMMALLGTICMIGKTLGFTTKSLRAQESMLLGVPYQMNQISYDLSRKGLIQRIPKTNTYALTGAVTASRQVRSNESTSNG